MRNHGIKWTPRFQNTTSTHREVGQCDRGSNPARLPTVSLIAVTSATAFHTIMITRVDWLVPMVEAFLNAPMPAGQVSQENQ